MKLIYTDAQNLFDEDADEMVAFDITPTDAQEIIRRVNAHKRLRDTLELTTKTLEAIRPVLSLDYSAEGFELVQLLDVVTGEAKAALALAAASESSTEGTPDAKQGTQGKDGE